MKVWTPAQAEALRQALAGRAARNEGLGYGELAGFLFAVACAPELVKPSEWLPQALPMDALAHEEAQRIIELVMALYNHVNLEVMERKPGLPAGIELRADPMENFGPQAPVGQWAAGYVMGQLWLKETWDECLRKEPDAQEVEDAFGLLSAALGFFAGREFAEEWLSATEDRLPLEDAARQVADGLPGAMMAMADIGRGMDEARSARVRTPARGAKVGRNERCPCGSGKKYKHCCGASA